MPEYYCKICDYKSEKLANYKRHLSSTKHLTKSTKNNKKKKVIDDDVKNNTKNTKTKPKPKTSTKTKNAETALQCTLCNQIFKTQRQLTKHIPDCVREYNYRQLKEIAEEQVNGEYDDSTYDPYDSYDSDTDSVIDEKGYQNHIMDFYITISELDDVSKFPYKVKREKEEKILKSFKCDKRGVERFLSDYRSGMLARSLATYVLKHFLVNFEKSYGDRLEYLIVDFLKNNKKRGLHTLTRLIKIMLGYVKTSVRSYHRVHGVPHIKYRTAELEYFLEYSKKIQDLVNDVDDSTLMKEIFRIVVPYIYINKFD